MPYINKASGSLSQRIELFSYSQSKNEFGEDVENFVSAGKVWAEVVFRIGKEKFNEDSTNSMQKVIMRIRYTDTLSVRDKVLYNNDYYNILSIVPMGSTKRDLLEMETLRQVK